EPIDIDPKDASSDPAGALNDDGGPSVVIGPVPGNPPRFSLPREENVDQSPSPFRGGATAAFPPEVSDLLTHLSRSVTNIVAKAYEEGLSNGRQAPPPAVPISNQPNRVEDKKKSLTQKNAATTFSSTGGDSGGGDETDSENYPRLRNKQRRQTGGRTELLNTFHLTNSLSQKEIRLFLALHNLLPPKKDPNFIPVCVSDDVLARFNVEGKTAGPKFGDPQQPFRLNWNGSITHDPWNVVGIDMLAYRLHCLFMERKDAEKFACFKRDPETFRKKIISRLRPMRTFFRKPVLRRYNDRSAARSRMRRAARRKNVSTVRSSHP
ncbi:hypothetical protein SCHPADRAFT_990218, partial [Schizopora paradoxa]